MFADAFEVPMPFIEVFMKIIPALAGTVGGGISGFLVSRHMEGVRRDLRLREEHLKELKQHVLQIFLNRLNGFYRPICERKRGAVVRWPTEITREPSSVTDQSYVRTEYRLRIKPILPERAGDLWAIPEIPVHSVEFQRYYEDAKQNHYPELIQDWEKFEKSFDTAAMHYLESSNKLAQDLRQRLGLPARVASHSLDKVWANYEGLTIFLYEHGLGIDRTHLFVQDYSNEPRTKISLWGTQEQVIQCAEPADTSKVLEIVKAAEKEIAPNVAEMRQVLEKLLPVCESLTKRIENAMGNNELPKACPFT